MISAKAVAPGSSATRKRRYRRRQRLGKLVLPVEVSGRLIATLIESGYLTEEESLDRRKVASAAGAVLIAWERYWREHNH